MITQEELEALGRHAQYASHRAWCDKERYQDPDISPSCTCGYEEAEAALSDEIKFWLNIGDVQTLKV